MSIFTITFKRNLQESKKEEIFDILIINLKGTLFKNIERIDNKKIIIEGEFFSFWPFRNVPWNIWTGFSRKTEVSVTDNNEILYSLDYTYAIIHAIISSILMFFLIPILYQIGITNIWYYLIIYLIISTISIGIRILQHRNLFLNTIKFGSRYKGKYDWEAILKTKSISELQNITNGNTTLTQEVQNLARVELLKRKDL